jgi:hypothetical protein
MHPNRQCTRQMNLMLKNFGSLKKEELLKNGTQDLENKERTSLFIRKRPKKMFLDGLILLKIKFTG